MTLTELTGRMKVFVAPPDAGGRVSTWLQLLDLCHLHWYLSYLQSITRSVVRLGPQNRTVQSKVEAASTNDAQLIYLIQSLFPVFLCPCGVTERKAAAEIMRICLCWGISPPGKHDSDRMKPARVWLWSLKHTKQTSCWCKGREVEAAAGKRSWLWHMHRQLVITLLSGCCLLSCCLGNVFTRRTRGPLLIECYRVLWSPLFQRTRL